MNFYILFTFFTSLHGAGQYQGKHVQYETSPASGWTQHFEKAFDGVKCDKPPLTKGKAGGGGSGFDQCRLRCINDLNCIFFSYWKKTRYCETYPSCDMQIPDEKGNDVTTYGRLTECDFELEQTGRSSSVITIAKQFKPEGIVQFEGDTGDTPNMVCQCTGLFFMICVIYVNPGSDVDIAVQKKFTRDNPENLHPFYAMPMADSSAPSIICVDLISAVTGVELFVEMDVLSYSQCIYRWQCSGKHDKIQDEERCPVMRTEFQESEVVFIMNADEEKAKRGEKVKCISINGLRALRSPLGITDPYGRGDGLHEYADYKKFILWDEETYQAGACRDWSAEPPRPGSSSQAGPSSLSPPSDLEFFPGPVTSPSGGQKKKKGKGKKKKAKKKSAKKEAGEQGEEDENEEEDETPQIPHAELSKLSITSPSSSSQQLENFVKPQEASSTDHSQMQAAPASAASPSLTSPSGTMLTPEQRSRRKHIRLMRGIPKEFLPSSSSTSHSGSQIPSDEERQEERVATFDKRELSFIFVFGILGFVLILLVSFQKPTSDDVYVEFLLDPSDRSTFKI